MNKPATKPHANRVLKALQAAYPDAHCELDHQDAFQLLVATVLSAQSTDVAVNRVTPVLFRRWPNPQKLAKAKLEAAGITPTPIDHEVTKSLYFADPDGNGVELYVDASDAWRREPQRVAQLMPLEM